MKKLFFVLLFIPSMIFGQEKWILFINNPNPKILKYVNTYIPPEYYGKYKQEIEIDSSYIQDDGSLQLIYIDRNRVDKTLALRNDSAINLGRAQKGQRKSDFFQFECVGYENCKNKVDSLRQNNILYFAEPDLETKYQYMINFVGEIDTVKYNGLTYSQIHQNIINKEIDVFSDFLKLYPEISKDAIHMIYYGDIQFWIYLKDKNFDFKRMKMMKMIFNQEDMNIEKTKFVITTM